MVTKGIIKKVKSEKGGSERGSSIKESKNSDDGLVKPWTRRGEDSSIKSVERRLDGMSVSSNSRIWKKKKKGTKRRN